MSELAQALLSTVVAAVVGGIIGWFGNYHVQFRIHRRVSRVDNLRQALYEYLSLASDYWHGAGADPSDRRLQEGRMMVAQRIFLLEYSEAAKTDKRINQSYVSTENARFRLWDSATGGCFQQSEWSPCPQRVRDAAGAVGEIVESLR